jgi:hypothetical protein
MMNVNSGKWKEPSVCFRWANFICTNAIAVAWKTFRRRCKLCAILSSLILMGCQKVTATLGSLGANDGLDPIAVRVTGPAVFSVGACQPFVLETINENTELDSVTVASKINLDDAGFSAGDFYSDSNCSTSASSVTFEPGESSHTFYYKSSLGNTSVSLSGVDPTNWLSSKPEIVVPNTIPEITHAACFRDSYVGESYQCQPQAIGIGELGDGAANWKVTASTCAWATMNAATGAIAGTPTAADAGICQMSFTVNDGFHTTSSGVWDVNIHVYATTGISELGGGGMFYCAVKNQEVQCWGGIAPGSWEIITRAFESIDQLR